MASEVPYTGLPTVPPRLEPTPSLNISATPDAFGVNVAEAVRHLGQVQEGAGRELFDRAYAMQELHVQAQANAAVADSQNKMMGTYLDYTQKEGKAAVDGYQGFLDDLDKIRDDGAKNITSPYGQLLYNQESRNSRFRLAFSGGIHAKDQNKQYVIGSSQARIKAAENAVELDPNNEATFKSGLDTIKGEISHLADVGGLPPGDPKRNEMVTEGVSDYVLKHIRGMAKNDPIGAQKLLDRAIADKDVVGEKVAEVGSYVRSQTLSIGTRHGASEVMSGQDLSYGNKVVGFGDAQTGIKAIEGGNYRIKGPTVTDKNGTTGYGLGAYQVMSYNLQGWLREAGMGPMSEEEFLGNKSAQDQLFNFKFGQYMEKYGSFNRAAKAWFGGPGTVDIDPEKMHDVNTDGLTYLRTANRAMVRGAPLANKVDEGKTYAAKVAPGDDEFADRLTQQIEILHNNDERIKRDTEFNNEQTITSALISGGGPDGKVPTTVEELKAVSPQVSEAWDQLLPTDQQKIMRQLASNAKGDVAWNEPRLREYDRLRGEATTEPDKFMSEDLIGANLPFTAKKELIGLKQSIYKKADAAPAVSHALQVLNDQLMSTGLKQDKENLAMFTGILHDAISTFQKDNDRPPNDEEIKVLGAQLLRTRVSGIWPLQSETPMFEVGDIPKDAADLIRNDPSWKLRGVEPTERDIAGVYWAAQASERAEEYTKFYGKPAPKSGETK